MWIQILTCIGVAYVAYISLPPGQPLAEFVKDYQTLIAAAFALYAVRWTVLKISEQIAQSERHHEEIRIQKFKAARAVLPLALSRLCAYSTEALEFAKSGYDNEGTDQNPPDVPDDIIPSLQDIIEFSKDDIASSVANLISDLQVQRARQSDAAFGWDDKYSLAIYDAADLYVYASRFFDYARKNTDAVPQQPTRQEVIKRLEFLGYREENYPFLGAGNDDNTDIEND